MSDVGETDTEGERERQRERGRAGPPQSALTLCPSSHTQSEAQRVSDLERQTNTGERRGGGEGEEGMEIEKEGGLGQVATISSDSSCDCLVTHTDWSTDSE